MDRKRLFGAIAAGVVGMMASVGMADTKVGTVILNQGSFSSGYGGEFQADLTYVTPPNFTVVTQASTYSVSGDGPVLGGSPPTAVGAFFQTFCIEQGLHDRVFYPGQTYDAFIVDQTTPTVPDAWAAVQNETKALYNAFYTGALANSSQTDKYGYDNSGIGRSASAGALQAAIWYSQGDDATWAAAFADAGISGNATAQTYAQYWYNEYTGQTSNNVQVLSLRTGTGDTTLAQAQLIETIPAAPLPSAAGTSVAMLAGLGLFSVLRKRISQPAKIG